MINVRLIRRLLWTYFWLLLFEGALRKWIFPGLSNPLLLVRDPIALLAVLHGWPLLIQPRYRVWIITLYGITVLAFLSAILVGHGDIFVAAYGARIYLLHFPLIFLFGEVFDQKDAIVFARILLVLSIPMTVLIAIQSNLPPNAFLNKGTGDVETAVFQGALGKFRPAGVFSFVNGLALFYFLSAAAFFQSIYEGVINIRLRVLYGVTGICLVIAVSVSISRMIMFSYVAVIIAVIASLVLSRTRLLPIITSLASILLIVIIATSLPAYQDTIEAFSARWESASLTESGQGGFQGGVGVIQNRQLGSFANALQNLDSYSFMGFGLGAGTQVGAVRLTGSQGFLIAEDMWANHLGELGLILGLAMIGWRVLLALKLLRMSVHAALVGNKLPLIMASAGSILMSSIPNSQPTSLGFIVVSCGLTIASAQKPKLLSHGSGYSSAHIYP